MAPATWSWLGDLSDPISSSVKLGQQSVLISKECLGTHVDTGRWDVLCLYKQALIIHRFRIYKLLTRYNERSWGLRGHLPTCAGQQQILSSPECGIPTEVEQETLCLLLSALRPKTSVLFGIRVVPHFSYFCVFLLVISPLEVARGLLLKHAPL